jgi:hypothetical protein
MSELAVLPSGINCSSDGHVIFCMDGALLFSRAVNIRGSALKTCTQRAGRKLSRLPEQDGGDHGHLLKASSELPTSAFSNANNFMQSHNSIHVGPTVAADKNLPLCICAIIVIISHQMNMMSKAIPHKITVLIRYPHTISY